ncbi:MAG: patatin-like phospholipase family protein [Neptuniibacter sp.]
MRNWDVWSIKSFILLVLLITTYGCATRDETSYVHPYESGKRFQAPIVDINEYKLMHARLGLNEKLSLAVAISGGGERAANLGLGVLLGLEDIENKNLLREVDYFSTVSGGGMPVAAYFSALHSYNIEASRTGEEKPFSLNEIVHERNSDFSRNCKNNNVEDYYDNVRADFTADPCLLRHLERGYHGNILRSFFNPRVTFTHLDRGDLLEEAFALELLGGNWNKNNHLTLGDVFIDKDDKEKKQKFPLWFTNATVFENGAIFPYTPGILEKYKISGYTHLTDDVKKAQNDSYREFAENMPLSLGLAASGNFPVLIAAQTLESEADPINKYLHLLDGGLADNLGITTAISVLNQEKLPVTTKVLIVVDAYPGTFQPFSKLKGSPNFVKTYLDLTDIPLNSLRGRVLERTKLFKQGVGSCVVLISFDELYQPSKGGNDFKEDADEINNLFSKIKVHYSHGNGYSSLEKLRSQYPGLSPFAIARGIKTSYNVTKEEQDFLIAVGKYLVDIKELEILNAVTGSCQNSGVK